MQWHGELFTGIEHFQVGLMMHCSLQACPHSSVQFRLRVPGIDLWTSHKPLAAELALQFILLGAGAAPCKLTQGECNVSITAKSRLTCPCKDWKMNVLRQAAPVQIMPG